MGSRDPNVLLVFSTTHQLVLHNYQISREELFLTVKVFKMFWRHSFTFSRAYVLAAGKYKLKLIHNTCLGTRTKLVTANSKITSTYMGDNFVLILKCHQSPCVEHEINVFCNLLPYIFATSLHRLDAFWLSPIDWTVNMRC